MFRRITKSDGDQGTAKLELRHQRTGDVVFDWIGIYFLYFQQFLQIL